MKDPRRHRCIAHIASWVTYSSLLLLPPPYCCPVICPFAYSILIVRCPVLRQLMFFIMGLICHHYTTAIDLRLQSKSSKNSINSSAYNAAIIPQLVAPCVEATKSILLTTGILRT